MVFGKKAEVKPWVWIVGGLVLLYVFNLGGFQDMVGGLFAADADDETGRPERCYIEDTTLSVGPAERMFAPTTKATADYHRLIKNGVDKGLYLDGSTVTVNPGDQISIFWAENSTTYYAAKQEFAVPCAGEVTAGEMPDSNAYKLYSNGTKPTVRAFNTNDGNLNADGTNQSLSAGDVETLDLELDGQYEKAMSPYGKIVAVCEGNSSIYDEIKIGDYPKGTVPAQHTSANADRKEWVYDLPNLISNAEINTQLIIDVDDTNGPDASNDKTDHDIRCTFYDEDWFQNSDTGVMEFGVENDQDADTGFKQGNAVNLRLAVHTD